MKNKTSKVSNPSVAFRKILVKSQPTSTFTSVGSVLPYGIDNMYPSRVKTAKADSPTMEGVTDALNMFINGKGFKGGDVVVNRNGDTANDILEGAVEDYVDLSGFSIFCKQDLFGRTTEIFNLKLEYLRKTADLKQVQMSVWDRHSYNPYTINESLIFDLYNPDEAVESIKNLGYENHRGQVYFYSGNGEIYPDSRFQSILYSAEFERESQIYSFANIYNGFSSSALVKLYTNAIGEDAEEEKETFTANLERSTGAGNAGSVHVVTMPIGTDGSAATTGNSVEFLTPPNADQLFINQNSQAEKAILKAGKMPLILLGMTSDGMFNQDSYNEAFDYKNTDCQSDRQKIEREFNKIFKNSTLGIKEAVIIPLEMRGGNKGDGQTSVAADGIVKDSTGDSMVSQNKANQTIAGLSAKQQNQMFNIIKKFKKGTLEKKEAEYMLKSYGVDEDNLNVLLS